jgi:arginine-tRNA-protein transferase
MESLFRFVAEPSRCGYLPDRLWSLEYEYVAAITPAEYGQRLTEGWRRFGPMLFRPACKGCTACRSLRVLADRFRPDRSQRRVRKMNEGQIELHVGQPSVTKTKLALYDRYHAYQSEVKGWPEHPTKDAASFADSFVNNPFAVEEWCYYLEGRLIGVGYLDLLPVGLSAIYFFHDPRERSRSLGTWNVLSVIEETARRGLPHTYLGYFIPGCRSMEYKARYVPNQIIQPEGDWRIFRE